MSPQKKAVYLTFDDGPVAGPTEWVLELLAKMSVKATFFCLGDNIRKYPHIFNSIVAHGHGIGNHTVNHLNGWRTPVETYVRNTAAFDCHAAEAGLARPTTLFRPPYGRITRRQISALKGYRIVMWDVLSQDYNHRLTPEKCLRRTLAACRPGSIIVFHDSYKAQRNMEYALPRLIEDLAGRGYAFKGIEQS